MAALSRRVIISGGPGTGKTALIEALAGAGHRCWEEVSRGLIREEQSRGGLLCPWADMSGFADACLERMERQLAESAGLDLCFFDRGIPDLAAYMRHAGLVPRQQLYARAADYLPIVFIAPPWRTIYTNDPERPQTFEESEAIDREIRRAYRGCGFTLLDLPRAPVAARALYVLSALTERSVLAAGAETAV